MSIKSNGRNSFVRRHPRTYSRASTTPSEDSDSEDDEKERRKYISLKGGQSFLWSAQKYGEHWDLEQGQGQIYDDDLLHAESNIILKTQFERCGSGRHSFKHLRNLTSFQLDNIDLNNDFEYGFNPNRPRGSKANNSVLLRPMSFFSPQTERKKEKLSKSFSDANNFYSSDTSRFSSSKTLVSFAQNDFEAQLERDVLLLRSQPCNLKFQGCKGKLDQSELAADLASARRQRFVRRHLSFDLKPGERWKKTLSLDSGLATDSSFKSLKAKHIFKQTIDEAKSEELLESETNKQALKDSHRTCKSVEFLDKISTDIPVEDHLQLHSPSDTIVPDSTETLTSETISKVLPPPDLECKAIDNEILLVSSEKDESNKIIEKTKRKGSIPHILSAFKLPNRRTFRKLIRKKVPETVTPVKVSHEIEILSDTSATQSTFNEVDEVDARTCAFIEKNKVVVGESFNTFSKVGESPSNIQSISSYSLPKVDEDKESFEFDLSLERRSKSSCSISFGQSKQQIKNQNDISMLHRRMSDTAISWDEKTSVGCSPGKRFVRRLFAPVVCGISSPDRFEVLNDSLQSLNSYDSSSLASENDISYPHLFDFASLDLVDELTLIDKELLIRIPWEELDNCGWMSPDKFLLAPNIMKMVQFFNRMAMLVTTNILLEETTYRRAKIIRKAIKLACRCRYTKNYNSLKAILSGLQCTPIFRLKNTWKQVPSRYRRLFRELSELMSEGNNFSIYRQEISQTLRNPPCIPFLGNFLTQVAHTHAFLAVQQKYKSPTSSNTDKHRQLSCNSQKSESDETGEISDLTSVIHLEVLESTDHASISSSSSTSSHTRNGSNDSGVVLNLNRLSVTSDDIVPSPIESGLNSPDDDNKTAEEVFKVNKSTEVLHIKESKHSKEKCSPSKFHSKHSNSRLHKTKDSKNINSVELRNKQFADIANIINSKPIEPLNSNELYECELEFWHYQISAVQYNIIPKSFIRRYLMDSPFNTEEDNYKLSLRREPPVQR